MKELDQIGGGGPDIYSKSMIYKGSQEHLCDDYLDLRK